MDKIEIIPNIITQEESNQIIAEIGPLASEKNVVSYNGGYSNSKMKKANCNDHPMIDVLLQRLQLTRDNLDIASYICYPVGSFNSPHRDNCYEENGNVVRVKPWTHSAIIYLNESFSGGELSYPEQGFMLKPKFGLCVMAPAGHNFIHSVSKIVSGERLAIVLRLIIQ
jgi:hypothetical protein